MFECEDHWFSQKDSTGLFVNGGGNYMGINCKVPFFTHWPFHLHFHSGVLGGQEGSQIFIENKHHLDLS